MSATEYEAVPAVDADAEAPQVGTLVLKFGGTSVADPDKLKSVAARLVLDFVFSRAHAEQP